MRRVRRAGTRHRAGGVTVFIAAGPTGPPRVATVASRKVGSAVGRNRAKRRLREALRRARLREGRDYVVVAGPEVVEAPFGALTAWVSKAIEED